MSVPAEDVVQALMTQQGDTCQSISLPHYSIAKGSEVIQGQMLAELIHSTVSGGDTGLIHSPTTLYAAELPPEFAGSIPEGTVLQMGVDTGILAVACVPGLGRAGGQGCPMVITQESVSESSETAINNVGAAIEDQCNAIMKSSACASGTLNQRERLPVQNECTAFQSQEEELDLDEIIGGKTSSTKETDYPAGCESQVSKNASVNEGTQTYDDEEEEETQETNEEHANSPDVKEDVVVIDVTQPIQLSHNSLIVVNGQRCVLQHCKETGQVIAYPIKEPDKVKRKRGRPRKQEAHIPESKTVQVSVSEYEEDEADELEGDSEIGTMEIHTEDGGLIRRSRRRRKKTCFLEDYATGSLQNELGSDEDAFSEGEISEQSNTPPRKKGFGRGRTKKSGSQVGTVSSQNYQSDNLFPFLQQPKRGRGRPRRFGVTPPSMQGFLIQTADGQSLMMQVPAASLPSHMSLQEVAENIASSLNTHMANQLAGLVNPNLKDALNSADTLFKTSELPEQITESSGNTALAGEEPESVPVSEDPPSNLNTPLVPRNPPARKRGRPRKYPLPPARNISRTTPVPSVSTVIENRAPEQHLAAIENNFPVPTNSANSQGNELPFDTLHSTAPLLPSLDTVDMFMVLNKDLPGHVQPTNGTLYLTPDPLQGGNKVTEQPVPAVSEQIEGVVMDDTMKDPEVPKEPVPFPVVNPESDGTSNHREERSVTVPSIESVAENFSEAGVVMEESHPVEEKQLDTGQTELDESSVLVPTQTTVIPVPDNILPLLSTKEDSPVKIGLKASDKDLERLRCSSCQYQAYYMLDYRKHLLTHENASKCKCCNFVVLSEEELVDHYKDQHPRNICSICNHTAEHAYILKRHMLRHNDGNCQCPLCGKHYKDQYILKMHIKLVHMPASVLFECFMCAKKFNRRAHLTRHLRTHDSKKPFKCLLCDYKSCEKSDLSKHMVIHNEPKHICEICGKAFRHFKSKEIHLKRHKGQRDFKCGVCDFTGYTFTDIRKHIERRHTDSQTVICDRCGQAFKTEELMKEHQKSNQCEVYVIEQALSENEVVHMLEASDLTEEEQQFVVPDDGSAGYCAETHQTLFLSNGEEVGDSMAPAVHEPQSEAEMTEEGADHLTVDGVVTATPGETSVLEAVQDGSTNHILISENGQFIASNSQLTVLTTPEEGTTQLALLSENGELSTLPTSTSQEVNQHLAAENGQPVTMITNEGLMLVV